MEELLNELKEKFSSVVIEVQEKDLKIKNNKDSYKEKI